MKRIILLALLCTFAQELIAKDKTKRIGVLYWSNTIEGQVAMRFGLEQKAEELQSLGDLKFEIVPYVAGDGPQGIKNQIHQMNLLVDQNVDLIIVQPTDNAALTEPLRRANRSQIPVVAYDQYIVGGKIASYVTSNNYQAGRLNGEYIDSLFENNYNLKIIVVEYPRVSSTVERVEGFFDSLKNSGQRYTILSRYEAVEPKSGKIAANEILAHYPEKNSIDVIFTVNDGGGLPIVEALHNAGRHEIKTATIDGDPQSVANIEAGRLTVIDSAQFCAELGRQSIGVAYKILTGKKVPKKIMVPTFPITKQTLHRYPGWNGSIPTTFSKPWKKDDTWNNNLQTR